jgi:hypothetical protein
MSPPPPKRSKRPRTTGFCVTQPPLSYSSLRRQFFRFFFQFSRISGPAPRQHPRSQGQSPQSHGQPRESLRQRPWPGHMFEKTLWATSQPPNQYGWSPRQPSGKHEPADASTCPSPRVTQEMSVSTRTVEARSPGDRPVPSSHPARLACQSPCHPGHPTGSRVNTPFAKDTALVLLQPMYSARQADTRGHDALPRSSG